LLKAKCKDVQTRVIVADFSKEASIKFYRDIMD